MKKIEDEDGPYLIKIPINVQKSKINKNRKS
jgi:hypothetical protein